jgi:hypothetical protein
MDVRKLIMFSRWKVIALMAGGIAGYAYYYYVGCVSGTCPITSNPWISTVYGALIGWLVVPGKRNNTPSETIIKEEQQ